MLHGTHQEVGDQVWGRVEVFVEGPALQENEVRISEISEGLQSIAITECLVKSCEIFGETVKN